MAAFDPPAAATVPGTPLVSAKRNGGTVRISWSEADNGGSGITSYNVLRSVSPGTETLLASVPASQLRYDDLSASDPALTYYYKVVAVNGQGQSCGDNEVAAKFVGDSYSAAGFTVASDPTADGAAAANPDLDIQALTISEPGNGPNAGNLVFNVKMTNLAVIPPDRRWRIIWNSQASPITSSGNHTGQFYVGMSSDAMGAVSFEYGFVDTPVVGLVLGDPQTTKLGEVDAGSFTPDGQITIAISRDKIGNPQTGDLLGNLSVRTYADSTNKVRSTNAVDTTTNASANDQTANAATYAIVGPQTARLQNISTRAQVGTDEKVLIGGFIITGTDAKRVLLRGRGPSLAGFQGITDPLHDPVLELYNSTPNQPAIATNDNWQSNQKDEINGTGLAPTSPLEAAIVQTLAPGAYTVIVRDKDTSAARLGIVEIFDVAPAANAQLGNLSSRGFVGGGDNVLIGGVILGGGTGNGTLFVRSLGPSLGSFGVSGALPDPTLRLVDQNGAELATNDSWRANEAAIQAQAPTLAPSRDEEPALIASLPPGQYTVVVEGKGANGVATVEIYALSP